MERSDWPTATITRSIWIKTPANYLIFRTIEPVLHRSRLVKECQPRGQCASVDDVDAASSECKALIYCSHNSHSLFSYSVFLARLEMTMGI